MKVRFKRTFFGPNGNRYRPNIDYEIPNEWDLPIKRDRLGKPVKDAAGNTIPDVAFIDRDFIAEPPPAPKRPPPRRVAI